MRRCDIVQYKSWKDYWFVMIEWPENVAVDDQYNLDWRAYSKATLHSSLQRAMAAIPDDCGYRIVTDPDKAREAIARMDCEIDADGNKTGL